MAVTSDQVAAYLPTIIAEARHHTGKYGAELDDLIQEGMIAVWLSLKGEVTPSTEFMNFRMENWVRFVRDRNRYNFEELWEEGAIAQLHEGGSEVACGALSG